MKQHSTTSEQEQKSIGLPLSEETIRQNYNLIEQGPIEGTPFILRKQLPEEDYDKEQWYITMGAYRITEPTETAIQSLTKLVTEQWSITTTVIAIIVEKTIRNDHETQKKQNQNSL